MTRKDRCEIGGMASASRAEDMCSAVIPASEVGGQGASPAFMPGRTPGSDVGQSRRVYAGQGQPVLSAIHSSSPSHDCGNVSCSLLEIACSRVRPASWP